MIGFQRTGKTKILSLLLAVCLLAGLLPVPAFAAGTGAMQLVDSGNETGGISGYDGTNGYHYVYYGEYSNAPIKWRVLDNKTNTGATGLFLLSEDLLGTGIYGGVYFDHTRSPSINAWQGSSAQSWCNTFASSSMTEKELAAIIETKKSDSAFTGSYAFAASDNILNNDKVFFLSMEETEKSTYGFTNSTSRIAKYNGSAAAWWLRSADAFVERNAGMIHADGFVRGSNVFYDWAARPAFNLNLNSVLFTSAAVGGKSSGAVGAAALQAISATTPTEWKLTLKDSSRSGFMASTTGRSGDTLIITYSGAATGTNEYISAIIKDCSGNITYYGRLKAAADSAAASGTVTVELPAGMSASDTLHIFNERYNGDKKTDYASELQQVTLPTLVYTITADPTGKDFGSLTEGYSAPTAQTITITNTSNQSVTLTQPTSTNYTIGTLSTTTLAAGGTATFTVTPNAGLAVGSHNETLTVSTTQSMSAMVSLSFTVTAAPIYTITFDAQNGTVSPASGTTGADGKLTSLPTPTRSNYTFIGWFTAVTGGTQVTASTVFTASSTIFARWSRNATGGINGYDGINGYHYVYYGEYGNAPIKWRVLDSKTNTGETGLFLLSEDLLGTGTKGGVYFDNTSPYSCAWQGSGAQNWCNTFASDSLTAGELAAIIETIKSDSAFLSNSFNFLFAASTNILNSDKVFFLSAEEAENSAYGFAGDTSRIANYNGGAGVWWLRSPFVGYDAGTDGAGVVYDSGKVFISDVPIARAARPAFNLNLHSVLFTSAAVGGKSSGAVGTAALQAISATTPTEWKLTLKDSSHSGFTASATAQSGNVLTVTYSGAATGTNEFISAIIKDRNGNITYYGRLKAAANSAAASGTVTVNLPSGMSASDTLHIFNERYNGDKKTDYASELQQVTLPTPVFYTISADPTGKNFGSLTEGYSAPSAQTVTITNTGNQIVTLTQPTSANYTIGTLSTTTLAADGTATFTVTPNAGLAAGNHNETLTVSTDHGTSATVSLSFTVTVRTYTVTYDANGGTGTAPTEDDKAAGATFIAAQSSGLTPPEGTLFKQWNKQADGGGTAYAAGATVTMPAENITLYAIWAAPHTITASAGAGGSISPSGETAIAEGASQTFTITANSGYEIASVTVDGAPQGIISTYTFTNVTETHTISATFNDLSNFGGGTGTENDPYQIRTKAQLAYLATRVNGGTSYSGIYFEMKNDIALNANSENYASWGTNSTGVTAWTPIGTDSKPFQGTFNGGGYTISGVFLNGGAVNKQGLFGEIGGTAVVKNLNLTQSFVRGQAWIGAVVGHINSATASVTDCSATDVEIVGRCYVGGLIGESAGTVTGCFVTGSVSYGADNTGSGGTGTFGGLIGYASGGTVAHCYSAANVSANGAGTDQGGLIGDCAASVSNCYATGNVTGTTTVGGLIASLFNGGTVATSYASGTVTGSGTVGGLVGNKASGGTVDATCYYSEATGQSDTGKGTKMTAAEMTSGTAFDDWDTNIWEFTAGMYPRIKASKDSDAAILWASPVILASGEKPSLVKTDFTLGGAAQGVVWTSSDESKVVISGGGAHIAGTGSVTLTATKGSASRTVTLSVALVYTITYDLNGGGGTLPTQGNKLANETFAAAQSSGLVPPEDKVFKQWNTQANGEGTAYAAGATVTMPAENITLYAIWQNLYTITYDLNGIGGTPPTESAKIVGATFTAAQTSGLTPPAGKMFKEWNTQANGEGTAYAAGATVTMPAENITLYAIWQTAHTITASAGAGGSISPAGETAIAEGASKTFTISANSGYEIASVTVDGAPQGAISTYTFTNVTEAHTISVTFTNLNIFGGGSGTESDPYQIKTKAQLAYLATKVNVGTSYSGIYFELQNDIALNANSGNYADWGTDASGVATWTPIGFYDSSSGQRAFSGMFDGGGHTVSGVYINGGNYTGLFGRVTGTVKNLGVTESYINGSGYVGGIVGHNNAGTVQNCYNTGVVSGTTYAGGIVGYNNAGTVQNCYNIGSVSGTEGVGGIVGSNYNGTVQNCYYSEATGQSDTGKGTKMTAAEMKSGTPLGGWDESIWQFTAGEYPTFKVTNIPPSTYNAIVTVNKDDSEWSTSAPTITIGTTSGTASANGSVFVNGTYNIYADGADTGVDITVSGTTATATLNYYTLTLTAGTGIDSVSIDSAGSSGVYLSGASANIDAVVSGGYTWEKWSDDNATKARTVTITATTTLTASATLTPPAFVAVTEITGVPASSTTGMPFTLTGTVVPANATNQTIVWSVKDAGATGATVSGNTLSATGAGTVVITATITNGTSESTNYTQDFTITVSAASVTTYTVTYDANDGSGTAPTENNKAAGDTFTAAAANSFTAPAGQRFKCWNTANDDSGTPYAAGATVTMPANALNLYAIWEIAPVVNSRLKITYLEGGGVRLNNVSVISTYSVQHPMDMDVRLEAVPNEGYTFTYWANGDTDSILSINPVYQRILGAGINIQAVFSKIPAEGDALFTVTFKDKSGRILQANGVNKGETASPPAQPAIVGYSFKEWSPAYTNVTSDLIVTAIYERLPATYAVTVEGGTLSTGGTQGTYQFDMPVTVVAGTAPAGQKFSHWIQDNVKVSTKSIFSFFAPMGGTTLKAVFVDESIPLNDVPFITLSDHVMADTENKTMMFTAIKNVPAGYTLVECGVMLVKSNVPLAGELTVDTPDALRLKLNNFSNDQFYVRKINITTGDTWYARAYLIYKDSNGNTVTVYSGTTVSQTMGGE